MRTIGTQSILCVLSVMVSGCCLPIISFDGEGYEDTQPPCTTDLDCGLGFACDPWRGCVPSAPSSNGNAHEAQRCTSDLERCVDRNVEQTCIDGSVTLTRCREGWMCVEDAGCRRPADCAEGERACDGNAMAVCANGVWRTVRACTEGTICIDGGCRDEREYRADLVIETMALSPTMVEVGAPVTLEFRARNAGLAPADGFTCEAYAVDVFSGAEVRLANWRIATGLDVEETWSAKAEFAADWGPSRYRIEARCDTRGEVVERDEINNIRAFETLLAVLNTEGVDLALEELRLEATDPIANDIRIAYVLTNLGPDTAALGHTCALYVTDSELDLGRDTPLLEVIEEETELVPNAPFEGHIEALLPTELESGSYNVSLRCLPIGFDDAFSDDNVAQLDGRFVVSD